MDQATSLRELVKRRNATQKGGLCHQLRRGTQIISVTSGKGGVGKSNVVANVAIALAQCGERVMIFDADFGLANLDVLFGLTPRWNLGHVLRGEKRLEEVLVHGPHNILIVPASSGLQEMAEMSAENRLDLIRQLTELDTAIDFLIIDTSSGITQNVTHWLAIADDIVVVTTPEPTALVDAYAIIKLVLSEHQSKPIGVVVNQIERPSDGAMVVDELNQITQQFLGRRVELYGGVARDTKLLQSVQAQLPLLDFAPDSEAGQDLRKVATLLRQSGLRRRIPPAPAPATLLHF